MRDVIARQLEKSTLIVNCVWAALSFRDGDDRMANLREGSLGDNSLPNSGSLVQYLACFHQLSFSGLGRRKRLLSQIEKCGGTK
jgi:hypothetical protein